jgi:predicted nucleic acid-binding protein
MMTPPVFVDTSAFYALTNPGDADHEAAMGILAEFDSQLAGLRTTSFVMAETYGLVLQRVGAWKARAFLASLRRSRTEVVSVSDADLLRAEAILYHYDDQDFSYVDAVSFAIIERLRIRRAFAFDQHFVVFKPRHGALAVNR